MNYIDVELFKRCNCGKTVDDKDVEAKEEYTGWGWFWWTMGTTAIPKSITFTCKKCNQDFEKITDKKKIKYYIFYRRN